MTPVSSRHLSRVIELACLVKYTLMSLTFPDALLPPEELSVTLCHAFCASQAA